MATAQTNQARTVTTTIAPKYVEKWSRKEALRELVQNAIDAKDQFSAGFTIDYAAGKVTISDTGPGLQLRHLAMGLSEKGPDSIGQFGEGLKLAMLVYAREKADCRLYSNGHIITPRMVMHPDLQTEVLAFDIEPNPVPHKGVTVIAECSKDELSWAKSQFLVLDPPKQTYSFIGVSVMLPGGKVYVNGQLVDEGEYRFTWALTDRSAINRDRTMFSQSNFSNAVQEACRQLNDPVLAGEFVKMAVSERDHSWKEFSVHWYNGWDKSHFRHVDAWQKAVAKLFGLRVCLYSPYSTASNGQAEYEGWKVIEPHDSWANLLRALLPDSVAATGGKAKYNLVEAYTLPQRPLTVLSEATRRVEKALKPYGKSLHGRVKVAENLMKDGRKVDGLYDPRSGIIFVDLNKLEYEHEAVSVLVHESAHMLTEGAEDLSRNFCAMLQDMMMRLLMRGR